MSQVKVRYCLILWCSQEHPGGSSVLISHGSQRMLNLIARYTSGTFCIECKYDLNQIYFLLDTSTNLAQCLKASLCVCVCAHTHEVHKIALPKKATKLTITNITLIDILQKQDHSIS